MRKSLKSVDKGEKIKEEDRTNQDCFAAFKHMTVHDNVALGLRARRRPKAEIAERVAQLLDLVQLGRLAHRYPRGSRASGWGSRGLAPSTRTCCCSRSRSKLSTRACAPSLARVRVTRDEAERLELERGQIVYAKPTRQTTFNLRLDHLGG